MGILEQIAAGRLTICAGHCKTQSAFGENIAIDQQGAVQGGPARVKALTLDALVVRGMIQCVCNEGIVSPVG